MGTYTSNYNLIKPAPEDFYNIADQNENMDIIDTQLKSLKDADDAFANHNHDGRYETPDGSQAKADAAQTASKGYTDQKVGSVETVVNAHLSDTMPHKFTSNGVTYKWGLSIVNGVVTFNYEEV